MIEQFWLFHCGWFRAPRGAFEKGAGLIETVRLPFLAAVAYHPQFGPIVIDAPFGHEGPANAGEVFGSFLRKAGQKFKPEWGIVPRIEQLGFRTSEVDHILMTHLHWDHTGGMKELGHARFQIAELEWAHAMSLGAVEALRAGYAQSDFRALASRVRRLNVEPSVDLSCGLDIFGDGSIEAVALPGHSPGHLGYRLRLTDGRSIFYLGDAVFSVAQVTDDVELGIFPRIAASSVPEAKLTLARLRDWWRRSDRCEILICSHDTTWGARCMDGPHPVHQ